MNARAVLWLALGLGAGAAGKPADGQATGESDARKLVMKPFRIVSVDSKTLRIEVKEAGYEVVWHATKTKLYRHRTVLLRDLEPGTALHVFAKRHEEGNDNKKKGGGRTSPIITDIELLGAGAAFVRPSLEGKVGGLTWESGKLTAKLPFSLEVGGTRYRLAGDDKLSAYSLETLAPEKLAGAKVFIRGNARKVTIEREGKPLEVTRLSATEVHILELSADHAKVFQSQWVERKKPGSGPQKGGKGAEKGK